jgi:hypothetical protein
MNAFLYLVLAWVALVFPITILQHNLYVATLGNYICFILAPKLRTLTTQSHTESAKDFSKWEVD